MNTTEHQIDESEINKVLKTGDLKSTFQLIQQESLKRQTSINKIDDQLSRVDGLNLYDNGTSHRAVMKNKEEEKKNSDLLMSKIILGCVSTNATLFRSLDNFISSRVKELIKDVNKAESLTELRTQYDDYQENFADIQEDIYEESLQQSDTMIRQLYDTAIENGDISANTPFPENLKESMGAIITAEQQAIYREEINSKGDALADLNQICIAPIASGSPTLKETKEQLYGEGQDRFSTMLNMMEESDLKQSFQKQIDDMRIEAINMENTIQAEFEKQELAMAQKAELRLEPETSTPDMSANINI